MALWGYCEAAQRLGLAGDCATMLIQWRPLYLQWMQSPINEDERMRLDWLDRLFRSTTGHAPSVTRL